MSGAVHFIIAVYENTRMGSAVRFSLPVPDSGQGTGWGSGRAVSVDTGKGARKENGTGKGVSMGHRDPLGKVIKVYRPNTAVGVMMAIFLCVAGGGVLLYCQFHRPYPYKIMLAGVVLLVAGPVMAGVSLFNSRRSLEIRRHGLRLVEGQNATDLAWDEVAEVEVNRTDVTGVGVATVWTRRSDLQRPGLLTSRTEWEVILHTHDGRTIRLGRTFLQYVPDVRSMVIQLRKFAGLQ